MPQKNNVVGTAFFQTAANLFHFNSESVVPKALLKLSIFPGGPDGEYSAGLEGPMRGGQPAIVIHSRVAVRGKCRGTVVHIEQHGIKPGRR